MKTIGLNNAAGCGGGGGGDDARVMAGVAIFYTLALCAALREIPTTIDSFARSRIIIQT